jgi:hypothetical protein
VNHRQQDNACENINGTSDNTMPSMVVVLWWRWKYKGSVMNLCVGFRRRQLRRPNSSRFWLHLHFSSDMLSRSYFNSARLTITAVKSKHDVDACAWMIYLQHRNKNYNYKHKEKEEEGEEIVDAWLHEFKF